MWLPEYQTQAREMSERADKVKPSSVKLTIVEVMVKSCHECSFAVGVGKSLLLRRKGKIGGPALEVTDDGRA